MDVKCGVASGSPSLVLEWAVSLGLAKMKGKERRNIQDGWGEEK